MRIHLFLLFLLFKWSGFVFAQSTNGEKAIQFVGFLAKAQYEEALGLTAADFKAKVSPDALAQIWTGLTQQLGAYESAQLADQLAKSTTPITVNTTFQHNIIPLTFHFNDQHQIIGFFMQQQPKARVGKSSSNFPEEEVKVKVNGGIIGGTIMTPKNSKANMPVALIIAGSGPTDRNGNSLRDVQTNSYLLLAEALADRGIASFRYDKRLIGESTNFDKGQDQVVFQDFVHDAMALGQFLRTRKTFGKLIIIGHSEGSNIGMIAAQTLKPSAFISLCGPATDMATLIQNQLATQPELAKQAQPIIQLLKKGKTTTQVPPTLSNLFAPIIQNFMISSFRIDPCKEISKLHHIPVLIIGGTTDLQVPVQEAEALRTALPEATLLLIKGMNHVLKEAPLLRSANLKTYHLPNLPLHEDLVMGLAHFLSYK